MRAALGHVYTITRHLGDRIRPPSVPPGTEFAVNLDDPAVGHVRLTGMHHRAGTNRLVILAHGLGGSIDSGYMRRFADAAASRGISVLRLNLRGADRSGADIYHAGLTDDVRAALASDDLRDYSSRVLIGFSLGGHMALRFAGESRGELDAVVAVCSPLDLSAGARFIDSRSRALYCRHLLRGLREIYAESYARIGSIVGATPEDAQSIKTIREWDDRIVARRFGFDGAEDYYAKATAIPFLEAISEPTLVVRAVSDPMISAKTAALDRLQSADIWRVDGGHIGFRRRSNIEARILDWLTRNLGW